MGGSATPEHQRRSTGEQPGCSSLERLRLGPRTRRNAYADAVAVTVCFDAFCLVVWSGSVYVRSQRLNASQERATSSHLADEIWAGLHRAPVRLWAGGETLRLVDVTHRGGHGEVLRRSRGEAAGAGCRHRPRRGFESERGNHPGGSFRTSSQLVGGQVHRRLMLSGWGGGTLRNAQERRRERCCVDPVGTPTEPASVCQELAGVCHMLACIWPLIASTAL